jgi:uncharacterized protein
MGPLMSETQMRPLQTHGFEMGISDLPFLARGCAVMGGGGGGDPLLGEVLARQAMVDRGPVRVVDLDDLPDDGLVMPCGLIGAPTVVLEKLHSGGEGARLVAEVEALCGRPVTAIMPFEIGGANGLIPLAWAARLGLPYVDADGMGRAFPLMPQMTMNLAGVSAQPCVVSDERANTLIVKADRVDWVERLVRAAADTLGGAGVAALYLMSVETARNATVRLSVSRALHLGRTIVAERSPLSEILQELDGVELIRGKVVDVDRRTTNGFVRGSAVVQRVAGDGGLLRLEIQNEYLVAIEDGEIRATVPDVITVLDSHDHEVVTTERLRYGQLVSVIAFPCDAIWRTPLGLEVTGPQAFGYGFGHVPLGGPGAQAA